MFQRIAKQGVIVFAGKVSFFLFGFLLNILLARYLGSKGLGQYQLGLVTIQLVTIFSVAGFDKGFVRFFPMLEVRNSTKGGSVLAQSAFFAFAISLLLTILLYFTAPALASGYFDSKEMTGVLRQFSLYIPIFTLLRLGGGATDGLKRADFSSNIHNVATPIIFLIFISIVCFWNLGLEGAIAARQGSHFLAAIAYSIFVIRRLQFSKPDLLDFKIIRDILSFSGPLLLIGVIYFLLGQMDIIMLGHFVSESEVGIYSVAVRLSGLVILGLEVGLPVIGPVFSQLSEREDTKALSKLFKNSTKIIFYLGLAIFAGIITFRQEMLSVFGSEFVIGASILVVLGTGQLMNVLSGPTGQLLVMTGKQKWEMYNSLAMVVANFFLNLFLIPKMGLLGAALATGISILSINLIKLVEVYVLYKFHPYNFSYLRGIMATLAAGVVVFFLRIYLMNSGLNIYTIILLGGSLYIVFLSIAMWFFGFTNDDKKFIMQLVRKSKLT